MPWITENRRNAAPEQADSPFLSDQMKQELSERYLPRYPNKRAVLLPALHLVQHEHGWIPMRAVQEVAEFLEISPAEALDTATFYEEYWLKPKGKYLLQVCRSLSCEICGSRQITDKIRKKLAVEVGETTADGKFTLIELECLGSCGTAPAALVNEVLFENLAPADVDRILDGLPDDPHEFKDPTMDW
jgi:NADH-quinone oxidoreductase subunit E